MTQKPDSVEPDRTDFDALLREVVKDEILKDARPTLESLKALHADRPLLVVALSQAIGALTERDALLREVEAGKNFIGGIYKLLDGHGDCERGCPICIAMRRIRETYLAALEGESR